LAISFKRGVLISKNRVSFIVLITFNVNSNKGFDYLIIIIDISLNSEVLEACSELRERFLNIAFSFTYLYIIELFIKVFLFVASYKVTFKSFNHLFYYIVFIKSS
jgi:hypothetical protein